MFQGVSSSRNYWCVQILFLSIRNKRPDSNKGNYRLLCESLLYNLVYTCFIWNDNFFSKSVFLLYSFIINIFSCTLFQTKLCLIYVTLKCIIYRIFNSSKVKREHCATWNYIRTWSKHSAIFMERASVQCLQSVLYSSHGVRDSTRSLVICRAGEALLLFFRSLCCCVYASE